MRTDEHHPKKYNIKLRSTERLFGLFLFRFIFVLMYFSRLFIDLKQKENIRYSFGVGNKYQ